MSKARNRHAFSKEQRTGGTPFGTIKRKPLNFRLPDPPVLEGAGFRRTTAQPARRALASSPSPQCTLRPRCPSIPRSGPACRRQGLSVNRPAGPDNSKAYTKPVRRNQYRFSPDFVQPVLVLDHSYLIAQLFLRPHRAILERKLKYETTHTNAPRENLPAAGSKGAPCHPVRQRSTALFCIFSLRSPAKS